jgi:hypothetical protein
VRTSTLYRYKVILSEIKIVSTLSRDEIKPVKAIKNLKNWKRWTCWKFWKKKSLIFSLWAHQMKIIEDHIVFIKIFSCSKLKTALWASYPNNQTLKLSNHSNICLFEWFDLIPTRHFLRNYWTDFVLFSKPNFLRSRLECIVKGIFQFFRNRSTWNFHNNFLIIIFCGAGLNAFWGSHTKVGMLPFGIEICSKKLQETQSIVFLLDFSFLRLIRSPR